MVKRAAILAVFALLASGAAAKDYICTEDPVWQEYVAGSRENLEGATLYPDQPACEAACVTNYECGDADEEHEVTLSSYGILDEASARRLNDKIAYHDITSFGLKQDGIQYWVVRGVRAADFVFPRLNDNDYNSWINGVGEKTTINGSDGARIEIVFSPTTADQPQISNNDSDDVLIQFQAMKAWRIDMIDRYGTRRESGNDGHEYLAYTLDSSTYYYCPVSRYENLGGDLLNGTAFTRKSDCDPKCHVQNPCVAKPADNCKVVAEEVSHPVTDYTGKTVYTRKTYQIKCTREEDVVTGCNRYEIVKNDGDFPIKVEALGYETKDFTRAFEDSLAMANMIEQLRHVWSGWAGYCEHGWLFDDSWLSDPMTLLSYALMAYDAVQAGVLGSDLQQATQDLETYFNDQAENLKKFLGSSSAQQTNDYAGTAVGSTMGHAVKETADGGKSMFEQIKEYNEIKQLHLWGDEYVKWTDIASIAASAFAEPEEEDYANAIDYTRTAMGAQAADDEALAYRQCMASIGLSVPNMFSYAVDSNATSPQLRDPVHNPIRMSKEQVAALVYATSADYVRTAYAVVDRTGDMYTLVAANGAAYSQAGRVICAGPEVAKAANALDKKGSEKEDGINSSAMANAAIKAALGHLPPPYNLVATVIFQVVTSFQHGNACDDEEIAMQWGLIQYKTNRFLNFEQCHHRGDKCVAKWFWGSCMRRREKYCCYDQIVTRIFVEGIKAQLGRGWESCNDLTINDLKNVSFRPCRDGESPAADKCFPKKSHEELKNALLRAVKKGGPDLAPLKDQVINSMAIPRR